MIRPYRMWLLSGLLVAAGCHLALSLDDLQITEGSGGSAGGTGGQAGHATGGGGNTGGGGGAACVPEECPDPGQPCLIATCDDADLCATATAPEGSDCVGQGDAKVCDAAGVCVECVGQDDCAQDEECTDGVCTPLACSDNQQGQQETDVDCGGPDCPPCANNGRCLIYRDCESGYCDTTGGTPGVCGPCAGAGDCNADSYCDPTDNTCKLKQSVGAPCSLPDQCTSGFCIDDVCCNSECSGFCQACSEAKHLQVGKDGVCLPIASGNPDGECATTEGCDGNGSDCTGCGASHPPPGDPTCPAVCNGGCAGNTCTINCLGASACEGDSLACPQGFHCLVDCDGDAACSGLVLQCQDIYDCELVCSLAVDACRDASIICGSGPCNLTCGECTNATMTCGTDSCFAECGAGATFPSLVFGQSCNTKICT